jgi:GAF domain-containing protein
MAEDGREQAGEFADLALRLHEKDSLEDTIGEVLDFAVRELDCSYAGVIFVHARQKIETVAATDPVVARLDEVQLACGDGPDLEVVAERRGFVVADTSADPRWPTWTRAVSDAGVRSVLGVPLRTTEQMIGSLNFYDVRPNHFDDDDVEVAQVLARHAAVALDSARDQDNLWRAIGSRHLIGMAQGVLMERFAIDADEAFAVLRRYSQDGNVKLHAVAEKVVAGRRRPEPTG